MPYVEWITIVAGGTGVVCESMKDIVVCYGLVFGRMDCLNGLVVHLVVVCCLKV